MDKFKKIMVGFFILASVNFVSINCFAVKIKNKQKKIVDIKSDVKQLSGEKKSNTNMQNMLKGKRTRNDIKRKRKNKQKKIVKIKSDVKQLSGEKKSNMNMQNMLKGKKTRNDIKRKRKNKQKKIVDIKSDVKQLSGEKKSNMNMQNMLKRNDIKQKENNGVIEKSEDKFKLVNIKNGIFNIKEIVEEIKLNILKYLSVSLFNKKIDRKKIGEILKENHINYSNFSFCCEKTNGYKYSFKIITPNLKKVDNTVKKNIKTQIEEYFNSLKNVVFYDALIKKLKAIEKQDTKYEKLITFFVKRTKKSFYTDNGQKINSVIEYIFDKLKEEKDYSKYLEILILN